MFGNFNLLLNWHPRKYLVFFFTLKLDLAIQRLKSIFRDADGCWSTIFLGEFRININMTTTLLLANQNAECCLGDVLNWSIFYEYGWVFFHLLTSCCWHFMALSPLLLAVVIFPFKKMDLISLSLLFLEKLY